MIVNASGCLDALTAPDVARSLDAFVTKTVTPLPREGNPPTRIAETDMGMLNSIGLANPGIDRFLEENLPRLQELGVPIWVSVGGFAADEYADICARLDREDDRRDRAERVLPERGVAGRHGRGDRDRGALGHVEAALHEALADPPGPARRGGPRRRSGDRRALARKHLARARTRSADARTGRRDRDRGPFRTRTSARRARRRVRLLPRNGPSDRRDGRGRNRPSRVRVDRRWSVRSCAWNGALRRSGRALSRARGARGGGADHVGSTVRRTLVASLTGCCLNGQKRLQNHHKHKTCATTRWC